MSGQLKVIHICYSDLVGGASRAAYRIHQCLLEASVDSEMWVNQSILDDFTIKTSKNKYGQFLHPVKRKIVGRVTSLFLKTKNLIIH